MTSVAAMATAMANMMSMSDRVWERHANPLSVWTRLPVLPLLCLAIWARIWIGWWCLAPIAALMVWTWLNPRIFPPPASTQSWASRGVMGERVWLARAEVPIPDHHAIWAVVLAAVAGLGLVPIIWGLWALELAWVLLGLALTVGGKLWFLDRMVWLFDDMARGEAVYAGWLR